jgi:hypothetical protein
VGRKLWPPLIALVTLSSGTAIGSPSAEVALATPFAEVAARFPLNADLAWAAGSSWWTAGPCGWPDPSDGMGVSRPGPSSG